MPGRNSQATQGGYSSGSTTVNGISYPTDLVVSDRYNDTPAEYKAATSIEFVGEYVDNGNDTYIAYIVDGNNPDPNPLSGGGATSGDAYRYGFNGQEHSNELDGDNYTALFWEYDSRICRRWNVDPEVRVYQSPYSTFSNNPIFNVDPYGDKDTTVGSANGGSATIDNEANQLEFYKSSENLVKGSNVKTPAQAGQLRSFTNSLGTFTAKWTVNSSGTADFAGYLNDKDQTIEKAVSELNELLSSWKYKFFAWAIPISERIRNRQESNPVGFVNDLMLMHLTLNMPGTGGAIGGGLGRGVTTGENMSALGTLNFAPKISAPLFHYTNEMCYMAIMESKVLNPSIGMKNARFGNGQYFTDIAPGMFTKGQTSYRLYGVPWNGRRLTHYIEVETSGLNIINNKPFNFLNPSTAPLNLNGRILGGGATGF